MNEPGDVVLTLRAARVDEAFRWAYRAAVNETLRLFSDDGGFDAAWVGFTRYQAFRDRLDRVFACGEYTLGAHSTGSGSLDVIYAGLSDEEASTLPGLAPGLVRRADLNLSPGWAVEDTRILIASARYGKLDRIQWSGMGKTKRAVAAMSVSDPTPTLFDDLDATELGGVLPAVPQFEGDLDTLVVAHSLDLVTNRVQLVVGRPRLGNGLGGAWHWKHNLLDAPTIRGGVPVEPRPQISDSVPDAPVRLRSVPVADKQLGTRS